MRSVDAHPRMLTAVVALAVACHSSPPPAPQPTAPAPPAAVEVVDASAPMVTADAGAAPEPVDASVPVTEAAVVDAGPTIPLRVNSMRFRAGSTAPRGTPGNHGSRVWIVVLGVGPERNTELWSLFERLNAERYAVALGDPHCIVAPEQAPAGLPSDEGAIWLTVEFATERDARRFAAALTDPPLWVGRGRVLCAD